MCVLRFLTNFVSISHLKCGEFFCKSVWRLFLLIMKEYDARQLRVVLINSEARVCVAVVVRVCHNLFSRDVTHRCI